MSLHRHTRNFLQWTMRHVIVLVYLSLQCGFMNVLVYFAFDPCGVSLVEVFAAPIVGTVAMGLIVFADRVQTTFLAHDELVWSLSAAHLGTHVQDNQPLFVRGVEWASALITKQLPSVFVRSTAVLGMQTALAMLRNEGGNVDAKM